jgi:alginate O-acetyltransferase complex protein AlgI
LVAGIRHLAVRIAGRFAEGIGAILYSTGFYLPFLIGALLVYWLLLRTARARIAFLAGGSMLFLFVAQLTTVAAERAATATGALFVLSAGVFWAGQRIRERPGLLHLFLFIVVPLSGLAFFKYLLPTLAWSGVLPKIAVPMGISYYTFKHIHYVIECSRGNFKDTRFTEYLSYIYFFPMFTAGPIERFSNFVTQARNISHSWRSVSEGLERIVFGLIKKFLVADLVLIPLLPPIHMIQGGAPDLAWTQVLLASFLRFLITYFDFSGYTDMVLGTGRFFGFRLMENFNFPLLRPNLAEFWRAWHISLSSWARDYIYFPILGRFRTPSLALLATMCTIGCWHSPAPGWAFWGLHHGTGLVILSFWHRAVQRNATMAALRSTVPWRIGSTLVTWWYISIGYALTFEAHAIGTSFGLYVKLLTFGLAS